MHNCACTMMYRLLNIFVNYTLKGLIFVNIPSWSAGADIWRVSDKEEKWDTQGTDLKFIDAKVISNLHEINDALHGKHGFPAIELIFCLV